VNRAPAGAADQIAGQAVLICLRLTTPVSPSTSTSYAYGVTVWPLSIQTAMSEFPTHAL